MNGHQGQDSEGFQSSVGDWEQTLGRRKRRGLLANIEKDGPEAMIDEITKAMENDEKLIADDVDGEMRRRWYYLD